MPDFPEIRIDVGIDDSSIDSSFSKIIAKTKLLETEVSNAMSGLLKSDGGAKATKQFEKAIVDITKLYNSLRKEMSTQLDMNVGIDTSKIQSEFATVQSELRTQLANLEVSLQQSSFSDEDLNLTSLENAISSIQEELSFLNTDAFASEDAMKRLSDAFDSLSVSVSGTEDLTGNLTDLASAEDSVTDNSDKLGDSVKNTSSEMKNANKSIDDTSNKLKGFSSNSNIASNAVSNLVKELLLLVSVDKLKDVGVDAIDLASSLVELQNVTDTVFEASASAIDDFADVALEDFGLAEASAREYASTIGAILGATGLADLVGTDALAEMSVNLTKLTSDMASFRNMEFEEVFNKIKSGITGETEAIKSLGVALYEADMQEYLLQQGIDETWSSLSNNEKILLRYNKILQDTSFVQGDFQKTSETFANSVRVLQERWKNLITLWGNYLIPVITPVVNSLNTLLKILTEVTYQMAQLFGWSDYSIISADLVSSTASMNDYLSSSVSDADDLATGISNAGKEAKKSLAPFTELNILSSQQDTSGTSGGVSIGGTDVGLASAYDTETIGYLEEMKNLLSEMEISKKAEDIVDFLTDMYKVAKVLLPLVEGIGAGMLTYSVLNKMGKGWEFITEQAGGLSKVFSGDFTGTAQTKMVKLAAAVGVLVVEFTSINALFDNFIIDKIDKDTGDFEGTVTDLGIAIGGTVALITAASIALYALLGPIGAVIGIGVGLTAAFLGVTDAIQKTHDGLTNLYLGGDMGFSDAFESIFNADFSGVVEGIDSLDASLSSLSSQREDFTASVDEFDRLSIISQGATTSIDGLSDSLINIGNSLISQASQIASANYQWAIYEIQTSSLSEQDKATAIQNVTDKLNSSLTSIQGYSDAWANATADGIVTNDELATITSTIEGLDSLIGGTRTSEYLVDIDTSNIDYSNLEEVQTTISEYETAISELNAEMISKRDEFIAQAMDSGLSEEDATATWDMSSYVESYKTALEQFDVDIQDLLTEYINKSSERVSAGDITVGEVRELSAPIADFTSLISEVQGYYTDLGGAAEDISITATETGANLNAAAQAWVDSVSNFDTGWFTTEGAQTSLDNAKALGQNIVDGYNLGLADQQALQETSNNAADIASTTLSSIADTQDSHSPSEESKLLGLYLVQGYSLGISENTYIVLSAIDLLFVAVFELMTQKTALAGQFGKDFSKSIADGVTDGKSGIENAIKDILNSMSNSINTWLDNLASILSSTSIALSSIQSSGDMQTASSTINSLEIPKLADGTVIRPNNEFVAILGDQTSGVNIETPLKTMLDAFSQALDSRGGGFSGSITIPIYVDGELTGTQIIDTQELERYRSNGK